MGYAGDKKFTRGSGSRPTGKAALGQRDSEFIQLELDVEAAQECKRFRKDVEAINLVLTEMLEDEYKLTLRYDDRNECFAAFAFPHDEHDNAGYILTGRGGSGVSALAELLFKHAHVLGRDWVGYASKSRKRFADDD